MKCNIFSDWLKNEVQYLQCLGKNWSLVYLLWLARKWSSISLVIWCKMKLHSSMIGWKMKLSNCSGRTENESQYERHMNVFGDWLKNGAQWLAEKCISVSPVTCLVNVSRWRDLGLRIQMVSIQIPERKTPLILHSHFDSETSVYMTTNRCTTANLSCYAWPTLTF